MTVARQLRPRAGISIHRARRPARAPHPQPWSARSGHAAPILDDAHEPAFTRSEAEARLLDLIRKARMPAPETNVRIGGYEVDFLWRDTKLVVEVDGFAYHSTREAFERDRRKDADLQALGLRTARVTYRQIAAEPEATIAHLSSMRAAQ